MTINGNDTKDLELAHTFARAYRELDEGAMKTTLASTARVRLLMPRGFFEHAGPDELLGVLRDFATKWTFDSVDSVEVELLTQNMMQTGRLACIDQRLRLRSANGERSATMVLKHLVAIKDGQIALVDELCTGVMPLPG
ncbi:MAG TPA: hypothetical protein VM686_15620 [Polyangiaceae bacterium]|nr:hypothetical protein [Polyangiaceae bacterium]